MFFEIMGILECFLYFLPIVYNIKYKSKDNIITIVLISIINFILMYLVSKDIVLNMFIIGLIVCFVMICINAKKLKKRTFIMSIFCFFIVLCTLYTLNGTVLDNCPPNLDIDEAGNVKIIRDDNKINNIILGIESFSLINLIGMVTINDIEENVEKEESND